MSKAVMLKPGTQKAIDDCVDHMLADLGHPEPPLRLEDVRELLRLDLQHYSSTDVTWLQERIHEIRVAGKQVLARPSLMLDVVKKLDLKALVLPDRKRILVDAELPSPKQRWSEAHEITHAVLPWHDGVAMGDKAKTLSITCHEQVETEANYGAGQLLFLGNRFTEHLRSQVTVNFETVKQLKGVFGNSMTTTLWRIVENMDGPAFGMVSIHPRMQAQPGQLAVRYFIRSRAFTEQFNHVSEMEIFAALGGFCFGRRGPIGESDVVIHNIKQERHVFHVECFNNYHDTLTLGIHQGIQASAVAVPHGAGL